MNHSSAITLCEKVGQRDFSLGRDILGGVKCLCLTYLLRTILKDLCVKFGTLVYFGIPSGQPVGVVFFLSVCIFLYPRWVVSLVPSTVNKSVRTSSFLSLHPKLRSNLRFTRYSFLRASKGCVIDDFT